ncbi:hypothetical protein [Domibacillus tundrae]|uniref:hypothetical protein n=1 Tax=Domibacillus tundrae TaxID=1587527 RepID=UPI0033998FE9
MLKKKGIKKIYYFFAEIVHFFKREIDCLFGKEASGAAVCRFRFSAGRTVKQRKSPPAALRRCGSKKAENMRTRPALNPLFFLGNHIVLKAEASYNLHRMSPSEKAFFPLLSDRFSCQ